MNYYHLEELKKRLRASSLCQPKTAAEKSQAARAQHAALGILLVAVRGDVVPSARDDPHLGVRVQGMQQRLTTRVRCADEAKVWQARRAPPARATIRVGAHAHGAARVGLRARTTVLESKPDRTDGKRGCFDAHRNAWARADEHHPARVRGGSSSTATASGAPLAQPPPAEALPPTAQLRTR